MRCCSAHTSCLGTYASGCNVSRRAATAPPGIARGHSPRLCATDATGGGVVTRRTSRAHSCAVVRASTKGRQRRAVGVVPHLLNRLSSAPLRVSLIRPRRRDGNGRRWGFPLHRLIRCTCHVSPGWGVSTRRTTRAPSCAVVQASTKGRWRKAVGVVPRLPLPHSQRGVTPCSAEHASGGRRGGFVWRAGSTTAHGGACWRLATVAVDASSHLWA